MKAPVRLVAVSGPEDTLAALRAAEGDILDAGGVDKLELEPGDELAVRVELT
jgi:hypothetical protein